MQVATSHVFQHDGWLAPGEVTVHWSSIQAGWGVAHEVVPCRQLRMIRPKNWATWFNLLSSLLCVLARKVICGKRAATWLMCFLAVASACGSKLSFAMLYGVSVSFKNLGSLMSPSQALIITALVRTNFNQLLVQPKFRLYGTHANLKKYIFGVSKMVQVEHFSVKKSPFLNLASHFSTTATKTIFVSHEFNPSLPVLTEDITLESPMSSTASPSMTWQGRHNDAGLMQGSCAQSGMVMSGSQQLRNKHTLSEQHHGSPSQNSAESIWVLSTMGM